mmetsp:Transcript_87725/g.220792  ORF Transcript_87725/g.220792 Transcript_87725/m.220792 type:complete len:220 (+) Transcript_87725:242-901(+)
MEDPLERPSRGHVSDHQASARLQRRGFVIADRRGAGARDRGGGGGRRGAQQEAQLARLEGRRPALALRDRGDLADRPPRLGGPRLLPRRFAFGATGCHTDAARLPRTLGLSRRHGASVGRATDVGLPRFRPRRARHDAAGQRLYGRRQVGRKRRQKRRKGWRQQRPGAKGRQDAAGAGRRRREGESCPERARATPRGADDRDAEEHPQQIYLRLAARAA